MMALTRWVWRCWTASGFVLVAAGLAVVSRRDEGAGPLDLLAGFVLVGSGPG